MSFVSIRTTDRSIALPCCMSGSLSFLRATSASSDAAHSNAEPREVSRYRQRSFVERFPFPSAMLRGMEVLALSSCPTALMRQPFKAVVDRLPGAISPREVAPRCPGCDDPQDTVQHAARVASWASDSSRLGQLRFDQRPLRVAYLMPLHCLRPPRSAWLGAGAGAGAGAGFSDKPQR